MLEFTSDGSVKPRDPEASIRIALKDVQCPRCNGYGRPRIIALARQPSIWRQWGGGRMAKNLNIFCRFSCLHASLADGGGSKVLTKK